MRKTLLTSILLLLLCCSTSDAQAQPDVATTPSLTERHHFLAGYEGTWTVELSTWSNAAAEPDKYTLTAVINTILGGRFLQCTQTGIIAGRPYEEWSMLGYQEEDKQLSLVQLSTAGTVIRMFRGIWADTEAPATLTSQDNQATPVRLVVRFPDPDTFILEQYEQHEQGEFKSCAYYFSRQ